MGENDIPRPTKSCAATSRVFAPGDLFYSVLLEEGKPGGVLGAEKPGAEKPGVEKPGVEKPGAEKSGTGKLGTEKPGVGAEKIGAGGGKVRRLDYAPEVWDAERVARGELPRSAGDSLGEFPPPFEILGWWRSVVPPVSEKRFRLAPNDILLDLFGRWYGQPGREDYLYILALLMVRRRIFRFEKEEKRVESDRLSAQNGPVPSGLSETIGEMNQKEGGTDFSPDFPVPPPIQSEMIVYSPRRETTYAIPVVPLDAERIAQIQESLAELLYSGPEAVGGEIGSEKNGENG